MFNATIKQNERCEATTTIINFFFKEAIHIFKELINQKDQPDNYNRH